MFLKERENDNQHLDHSIYSSSASLSTSFSIINTNIIFIVTPLIKTKWPVQVDITDCRWLFSVPALLPIDGMHDCQSVHKTSPIRLQMKCEVFVNHCSFSSIHSIQWRHTCFSSYMCMCVWPAWIWTYQSIHFILLCL